MTSPLLDVHNLSVRITRDEGVVRPLNGVSFRINTRLNTRHKWSNVLPS